MQRSLINGRSKRITRTNMNETIRFITAFFVSKKLSLLTTFLCWKPDELHEIWRGSQAAGVRARWGAGDLQPDGLYREGVLLDLGCSDAGDVLRAASTSRAFNYRYSWLLLHNSTFDSSIVNENLGKSIILPDADVTWAATDKLVDIYKVKVNQPFVMMELGVDRNSSQQTMEQLWEVLKPTVARRKNLNNVYLTAATIITQPQHFKGWSDLTVRHIDTFPKLTYPIMKLCAEDLNFRLNLRQVDLYGEEYNGSFNGLAGLLQRREIEIGVTSMFMRGDRLRVLHFSSETVVIRGAFLFRQPPQSSVSNVFMLPFSRGVWAACALVFAAAGALLAVLSRPLRLVASDDTLVQLTPSETFTFAVGAICQQGFHVNPQVMSVRMVMFFTLLASLFAFTSYSAKIVAILQTPSNAIQTIDDLTRSPMTLGVQETTYKRVYFAESNDPATQRLYRHKLLPLGERAYMSVVDGVARLRTGLFAFQVEESSGYDIISKTFTEREKCGLKEITAFQMPTVAVPIQRHSGYRELLAARLRWQRETGLMERTRRVWLASKPRCDADGAGFLSVRLADVLPAVQVLSYGTLFASILFLVEIATKRAIDYRVMKRRMNKNKDTIN